MVQPVTQSTAALAPAEIAPATVSADDDAAEGNYDEVKSPMIGTFYRSSTPDKPPFVSVGDDVKKGDVLCIIEAMKLFNEIESEVSGKIVKVLIDDSSPTEYDQPLFLIEPA
jgi:acetyl-CoA carboxylase biotin carboxyl carrier protein